MSKKPYQIREAVAEALGRRGFIRLPDHHYHWVFQLPPCAKSMFIGKMGNLRYGLDFDNSKSLTNTLDYVKLLNEGATTLMARVEEERNAHNTRRVGCRN